MMNAVAAAKAVAAAAGEGNTDSRRESSVESSCAVEAEGEFEAANTTTEGESAPAESEAVLEASVSVKAVSWLLLARRMIGDIDQNHLICRLLLLCWHNAAESDILRRVLRKVKA